MNITPDLLMKTILNTSLISRLDTLKPKGHGDIAEGSKGSDESCLLLVLNYHFDLMITGVSIQKAQMVTTRRSIDDLINTREGKGVCRTSFVQVCLIYTHMPSAVFLKNQHRISKPLWMEHLNDKASC